MWELPLIFVYGLLASAHCFGMCGPIVATLGVGASSWRQIMGRQCGYHAGRICTYSALGAILAFGGWRIAERFPGLTILPACLAVIAGILLCGEGLFAAGLIRHPAIGSRRMPCLLASPVAGLLVRRSALGAFLAGVVTGFFPCGLLYAFLATAASTANMAHGALVMAAFGFGAVPMLLATALGATFVRGPARKYVYRLAACCVVLTGLVCITRGVTSLAHPAESSTIAAQPESEPPSALQAHESLWCR
jgi:sulfite exporter TauE/SafE